MVDLLYKLLQINGLIQKLLQFYWFRENWRFSGTTFLARGVCQGCILSPLLFNLYINDLSYSFENSLADSLILPDGTKLSSRLYADDLIIPSRPKTGLQNCLNSLAQYCRSWMLNINKKSQRYDFSTTREKRWQQFLYKQRKD